MTINMKTYNCEIHCLFTELINHVGAKKPDYINPTERKTTRSRIKYSLKNNIQYKKGFFLHISRRLTV